jgi:hypothetical protein
MYQISGSAERALRHHEAIYAAIEASDSLEAQVGRRSTESVGAEKSVRRDPLTAPAAARATSHRVHGTDMRQPRGFPPVGCGCTETALLPERLQAGDPTSASGAPPSHLRSGEHGLDCGFSAAEIDRSGGVDLANRRALASALDAVAVAGCVRLVNWSSADRSDDAGPFVADDDAPLVREHRDVRMAQAARSDLDGNLVRTRIVDRKFED